jgi:putative spermidine/putrescine transport system permease protein
MSQRVSPAVRRTRDIVLLLSPAVLVLIILFAGGVTMGLLQSLGYLPAAGFEDFSPRAYIEVFRSPGFLHSFGLTLWVSLVSTIVTIVLAVLTALVLRHGFRGRGLLTFIYQFPLTVPHIVVAAGMLTLVSQSGLLSRIAFNLGLISEQAEFPILVHDDWGVGIILVYLWKQVPFIGLIALAVLQSIGEDYEELARSLGASSWQRFRHVLLPLMLPGLIPGSIIIFAFVFGSFEVPYLMGESFPTMLSVLSYRLYIDTDLSLRPQAMAVSVTIAVMVLVLVGIYQKLTRGYTEVGER